MGIFGFLGKKKAVNYKLTDRQGRALSIGVTNFPAKRMAQHSQSGKKFSRFIITSKVLPRSTAERNETRNLRSYRNATGRRPKYNKTWNGKFN